MGIGSNGLDKVCLGDIRSGYREAMDGTVTFFIFLKLLAGNLVL